jgi:CBS domain-containing protein
MSMTVGNMMKKKLETIHEMASVQQTAKEMNEKNVSSLVVVDANGKPQGIVTERDLARRVCISAVSANAVTNQEIMSSPLITITSDSSPSLAADMMLQHNVRHLLVVDKSTTPIGIITPLDFTRNQEYPNDNADKDAIEKILEYYL